MIQTQCLNCRKDVFRKPAEIKRGGGRFCSHRCSKWAEFNPNWKGGYIGTGTAIHEWIKRRILKVSECKKCGDASLRLDLANVSQKYKRDLEDWMWLCRKCHMEMDGRLENFRKVAIGKHRDWCECHACLRDVDFAVEQ